MSVPREHIERLSMRIREFWTSHENKFKEIWKALEPEAKTKFCVACTGACSAMCASVCPVDVLMPEINLMNLLADTEALYRLFWYYYTDDGFALDQKMVEDLHLQGLIASAVPTAIGIRQMGILTVLNQAIEMYEALFHKGLSQTVVSDEERKRQEKADGMAAQLKDQVSFLFCSYLLCNFVWFRLVRVAITDVPLTYLA